MEPSTISDTPKKSFFDLLQPKQAFVLGCISTLLVMGTVGFVALGTYVVKGGAAGGFTRTDYTSTTDSADEAVAAEDTIQAQGAVAAAAPSAATAPCA